MSHIFSRISKLSSPLSRRLCSTWSEFSTMTPSPYLLLGKSPYGDKIVNFNLYDPRKEEHVKLEKQTLSKNGGGSYMIGASRGWLAIRNKHDSTVGLTNIFDDPSKKISFPPLIQDETERLLNVYVSSSSSEDCVVAAKFKGSRVSLCRLGDSEWTRVDVPCPLFSSSLVMYSNRDQKFYLNSYGSDYTGPTNFSSESGLSVSLCVTYPLSYSPMFHNDLHQLHDLNFFQILVELPSGESFIVFCAVDCFTDR